MQDQSKTKQELIQELVSLRQRIAELEQSESEHKQAGVRDRLAHEVLEILNHTNSSTDTICDILHLIKDRTGFEAVGIRLREGDDFPYYETNGFSEGFILAERSLCAHDEKGKIIRDGRGNPVLECMCGNILCRRIDHSLSFFTEGGSFWSNCTSELLASSTEEDRQARTRNRCNGEGYESVALIPLRSDDDIIGLLQLNDRRHSQFTPDMIRFFEGLGESIGIALSRKQAEETLREVEENFHRSLDDSPLGIRIVSAEGETIYANQAILDIYGYDNIEELKTTPTVKRYTSESYAEFQIRREKRKRGDYNPSEYKISISSKSGNIHHLQAFRKEILWNGKRQFQVLYQDITDRKRVEEALRENEYVFRLLFEKSGDASLLIEENRFIDCNEAALEILGYSDKSTFINMKPADISPERQPDGELSSEKAAKILKVAFNEGSNRFEWVHKKLDDTPVHMDVILTPIEMKGRKLIYTTWRDITEWKKAEKALKRSERQLADIIDFLPDATFVIDMNGKVITWNRAMEEMTGVSKDDMLGQGDRVHAIPFYGERRKYLLDLLDSSNEDIESNYQYVRRKGTTLYAEIFAPALNGGKGAYVWATGAALYDADGSRFGAIESIRDITDKKMAEEALKKSEALFRMLIDYDPLGISLINEEDVFEYINPQFSEIFGYSLEDIINAQAWFETVFPEPNDRPQVKILSEEDFIKGTKNSIWDRTAHVQCKDKKEKIITTRAKILDDGRKLIFYEDITERCAIEAQLRQAHKMEAIGTLAAGIAHDFNNVLGGMLGYTEMSLLHIDTGNPLLKRYLEQIRSGIHRATDLVKQILTFSRQTVQEVRPIRVTPLLKETLKLIRAAIPSSIEIIYNVDANRDLILADPTSLHQILMNLCSNAAHAMREKGGVLRIEIVNFYVDEDNQISVDVKAGWHVRMTVSDTGQGIDAAIIDRIFDPFFTTKKIGEGTGLGLAVVHGIVKNLGGAIIARSYSGEGAVFEIYLPVVEGKDDAVDKNSEKTYVGGKERILFVDDEDVMTGIASEMLGKMGYDILVTTSSVAALKAFSRQPNHFDIVVTDQAMPEMTGMTMAKEILKIRPGLPIILCTGFSEIVTPELIEAIGISGFIMKPFTMTDLDATIRKVLLRKT